MAQEIELKMVVTAAGLAELATRLADRFGVDWQAQHLANTYFDTPDLALNARKVALRIREVDGRFIQTLKTKGVSVGGLHQRGEWEWEVPASRLFPEFLQGTAFPAELNPDHLVPIFRTDFERRSLLLNRADTDIEIALDDGAVLVGGRSAALHEVELELKSGAPNVIFELAMEIAQLVPIWLSDVSKAERGYRLWAQVPGKVRPYWDSHRVPTSECLQSDYRNWLRATELFRSERSVAALVSTQGWLACLCRSLEYSSIATETRDACVTLLREEANLLDQLLSQATAQNSGDVFQQYDQSFLAGRLALVLSRTLALADVASR